MADCVRRGAEGRSGVRDHQVLGSLLFRGEQPGGLPPVCLRRAAACTGALHRPDGDLVPLARKEELRRKQQDAEAAELDVGLVRRRLPGGEGAKPGHGIALEPADEGEGEINLVTSPARMYSRIRLSAAAYSSDCSKGCHSGLKLTGRRKASRPGRSGVAAGMQGIG